MSQSRKQNDAIQALLEQPSLSAAALVVGIDRRTLQRWLRDPDFLRRLREARGQAFDHSMSRLCYSADKAVDVLLRGLENGDITRIRFWCARAVLELAAESHKDDIEARVTRLEYLVDHKDDLVGSDRPVPELPDGSPGAGT